MSTRLGLSDAATPGPGLAPGTVVAGRYRVVAELGAGAMGAVFLAEHTALGRRVALKTIHRELLGSAEAVARFEREALASARVDHPNVVAATDVVALADGSPALVLEYVQGRSLARRLAEEGPLPLDLAQRLLADLAGALTVAHEAGVVHRDLKPENLLLVERDGLPIALKILDFGIAKLVGEAASAVSANAPGTQLGLVYGTPRYMAPEQAVGQAVDARVDLYAAGVLAYEMLAGRVPFDGPDLTAIVTRQLTEAPSRLPETVPAPLRDLVRDLLAPRPDDRVPSARELAARLAAISHARATNSLAVPPAAPAGAEVVAPAPAAARTTAPPRTRVVLAIAAALALALLGALLVGRARSGAPSGGVLAQVLAPSRAPDDELARAKVAGRSALESLAFRFPEDAAIVAALVEVAHAEGASLLVAKHLARLADLDAARAEGFAALAEGHAAKSEEAAAAIVPLLAERLGARGLDAVVTLADQKKGPARKAALEALASEAVRGRLSPGARVLVDARAAKACADRRALLPRMVAEGDARLASVVAGWSSETGCGFLTLGDCHPCLRAKESRAQLAELKARFSDPAPR